ncbi:capsule biosynthesis protein [Xenorhabdus mauleonii]|uniref:Capsule biosynthesis protein n=1 Tax=Xenorhabdus mauleonii TaxID=351675 RepID=A0A1I3U0H7_9GAMM|nr:stealth family protein [Xenorhabdus mauleonii]PHM39565.1 capsule biosynthesis protein [Xenorhabdus mauleonii]SFJ75281.1 Stealth protein CR1, conserved region 1 [Xenorhabdus mauleonii]
MNTKIDFVLPWVDGNDILWQKRRRLYSTNKASIDENSNARFRDFDTLKYVLRSIEKNCPWYNKIFLITEGHYPNWLNLTNPKIRLVTHEELYFNKEDLPTFSSSSIEMNLANLPDLSNKFIYLNDDMIIFKQLPIERFFIKNLPVDFLCHGFLPRGRLFSLLKEIDTWINSINNNISLINKIRSPNQLNNHYLFNKSYGLTGNILNFLLKYFIKKYFWFEHWHHPQPYIKEEILKVHAQYEKEMSICSKNKFRSNNDLTQYLYRYWNLTAGQFYPQKYNDGLVKNIESTFSLERMIKEIKLKNFNFICFNDSTALSDKEFFSVKNKLILFLDENFPVPASFEKSRDQY